MIDCNGNELKPGDKFIYRALPRDYQGTVIIFNDEHHIEWDDGRIIPVDDFYFEYIDKPLLGKLND